MSDTFLGLFQYCLMFFLLYSELIMLSEDKCCKKYLLVSNSAIATLRREGCGLLT